VIPFLIFLLGTLTTGYHLGTTGLLETSEGRYASVARHMHDSGDYTIPVNNGLKHFTKPPLTYWITATGIKLFGVNEFGARFFLAFAAGVTAAGTWAIGKTLFGHSAAIASSLILICSLFFQIQSRGLTTDPYLAMFETLMVLGFIKFIFNRRSEFLAWHSIFFWLMASLAMLTKGPPGLLPLAGLIPACIISGRKKDIKVLFSSLVGWIIFIVIGLGWYLLVALKTPGLMSYFLVDETLKRVASNAHRRSNPFYLFLVLLPAGIFPWTSFFIRGLKEKYRDAKQNFISLLILFWIAIPLVIFTLSRSKLAGYVLPLMVPVALLTGWILTSLFFGNKKMKADLDFHIKFNSIAITLLGTAILTGGFNQAFVANTLNSCLVFIGSFWILTGILIWLQNHFNNKMAAFALLCFVAPGFIFFSIPGIKGNEQLSPKKYLPSAYRLLNRLSNLPPEQKIITIEEFIEGWYFYTGQDPVTFDVFRETRFDPNTELVLNGADELNKALNNNTMLILKAKSLDRIAEKLDYNLKTIASEGKWIVAIPKTKTGH
jgi:hypothetical protein